MRRRGIVKPQVEVEEGFSSDDDKKSPSVTINNDVDMTPAAQPAQVIEDAPVIHAMLKPSFVSKKQRELMLAHGDTLNKSSTATEDSELKRDVAINQLVTIVKNAEQIDAADDSNNVVEEVDDTDHFTEEEYEAWKLRELNRLARDERQRQERERVEEERQSRLRFRDDKDESRQREKAVEERKASRSGKFVFMQKYYHQGAFFQADEKTVDQTLFERDFAAPTPQDLAQAKAQSTGLKAFQVRRGDVNKARRSKWTHLKDADTTDFSSAWAQTIQQNH